MMIDDDDDYNNMTTLTFDCGRVLKFVDTFANCLHVIFIIHVFG